MSEIPNEFPETQDFRQEDFERISHLVTLEFQVEEAFLDRGIPTYYLRWPQETKQAFLRLLEKLEGLKLLAFLRRANGRVILRVVSKPPVRQSNPVIYWVLFFSTVATTFVVGYLSFEGSGLNPLLSGAIFSATMLTVLGLHEMGHKITANRKKVEATSPYFIPGPPPLGTLGAVIMQKSLPPNRDALFDIGANGPLAGFLVALVFSVFGLMLLTPTTIGADSGTVPFMPLSWVSILLPVLSGLNLIPPLTGASNGYALNPIAWAGWAGMIVTMINLLPAGMLDGGHVAKSLLPDKSRYLLTIASVAILIFSGTSFLFMAFIVVFMSLFKHPGPLDDVSGLSRKRKLLTIGLVGIFALAFPINLV